MSSVRISRFSLVAVHPSDEAAIRQWYELCHKVARADWPDDPPPCWINELGRVRHPWPGEDETVWLARIGGAESGDSGSGGSVVGGCLLNLPMLDNLENATGDIVVAPEHRRSGIGRVLLDHLRSQAIWQGRIRLIAQTDQPLDPAAPDPGGRFVAASGAELGLVETRRRLDIASIDPAVLTRLDEQARAMSGGYSLVQWVGSTPERWLDDIAYLTGRMTTDAPLDDLQWEAEAYDAARMRARDVSCLSRGLHIVTTGAVDGAGRLVAFTQIHGYATSPWYAEQWVTIVAPEHRGHRLGTLIKVANLELARAQRPELLVIDTWNADSNPYMVGINEAMGFRPHSRVGEWQLDL
ncbi:MAG: GNAT family N-acetyltransferase [Pseudonocardiales bacterium]